METNIARAVRDLKEEPSKARTTNHRALENKTELKPLFAAIEKQHLGTCLKFEEACGLRIGEAGAITPDDIDENFIYIRRTITLDENGKHIMGKRPKTESSIRKIPINNTIRELLDKTEMPDDGGPIFRTSKGNYVNSNAMNLMIKRVLKSLDKQGIHIDHLTTHSMRNTFATDYVEANADKGGDYKTLQELLGHKSLAMTTDTYVHNHDHSKIEGMARLDC